MTDIDRILDALEKRGPGRMVPDKSRIEALLDLLGHPERAYPSIHITGTNGKTSTARMIDSLLRAFGVRVGRYTSPHLDRVTERISIDGEPITDDKFVEAYDDVEPFANLLDERNEHAVTYHEILTAVALAAYADAPVDVAVVEVGLGGEWDATNVLFAPVAVITPIGMDHMHLLGDTITKIATEKAGIIHSGATVITAIQEQDAAEVLLRRAVEKEATVAREGLEFGVVERAVAVGGQMVKLQGLGGIYDEIFLPLHGEYQAENAVMALAAVEAFFGAGPDRQLDIDAVREGFAGSSSPGRLERVRSSPTVLVDAAHNEPGMRATVQALGESFGFSKLVAVVAVLDDKDARGMLELLEPVVDSIVVTENSSPRRLATDYLAAIAVDVFGPDRVDVAPRMDDAIESAITIAEENADEMISAVGVLITGSVITAADARRLLKR